MVLIPIDTVIAEEQVYNSGRFHPRQTPRTLPKEGCFPERIRGHPLADQGIMQE